MIGKTAITTLGNGCRVVTSEMPGVESVSLCFDAGTGSRFEAESELGAEILQAEVVLRKSVVAAMKIPPEELNDFVVKSVLAVNDKLLDYEHISKVVIRDKDFDRTPAMKIIRPKKVYGK